MADAKYSLSYTTQQLLFGIDLAKSHERNMFIDDRTCAGIRHTVNNDSLRQVRNIQIKPILNRGTEHENSGEARTAGGGRVE